MMLFFTLKKKKKISEKAEIISAKACSGQEHVLQERMNTTVPAQGELEQRPLRRPRGEGLSQREVKPLGKRLGRSWRRLRTGVSAVPSPRPRARGDPALIRHGPPRPGPAAPRHSHGQTAPSALFPLVGFARKVPEGTGTPIPLYFHNT